MELSPNEIKKVIAKHYPDLEEDDFNTFLSITRYEIYNNKEIIQKKGRTDKSLFIILKGAARAYTINSEGSEQNNHLRGEGFLFGDPKVFSNETQTMDMEAIGKTHILKFNVCHLESLGYDNTNIMKFYLAMLKEVITTFSHRISTFVTMTSLERYEDLIRWNPLYLQNTYDKHLASFLGITPLTFHRIKKKAVTTQQD